MSDLTELFGKIWDIDERYEAVFDPDFIDDIEHIVYECFEALKENDIYISGRTIESINRTITELSDIVIMSIGTLLRYVKYNTYTDSRDLAVFTAIQMINMKVEYNLIREWKKDDSTA